MGPYQPGQAPGASVQQLARQVQIAVTEALRTLDTMQAIDPSGQDEVDSLRSVVWSDLTGLEAEFAREAGPRSELLDRFFSHLLSSGDHIGQIEALAGALLGGAPPPSQPAPDSPVAGLFRLHSALANVRRQWQEIASTRASQPAPPSMGTGQPAPAAVPRASDEPHSSARENVFDELDLRPAPKQEMGAGAQAAETRARALAERHPMPPARQNSPDRFLDELGFSGGVVPGRAPDVDTPRPRVLLSFVTVFVILALMGVGVIYLGLNSGPQGSASIRPSVVPTFSITIPTETPSPTPTLSSAPPRLQVTGNPLIVPCPHKGSSGFVLRNTGGRTLTWKAKVNPVEGANKPVSLNPSAGSLYGPPNSGTDTVSINVTANVGNIDGTITITSNASDPQQITYHIHGC